MRKDKKDLAEEIDCFDDMHTHITEEIMQSPKNVLISKSKEIITLIQEINRKPNYQFDEKNVESEFSNDIIPNYESDMFIIKNYS